MQDTCWIHSTWMQLAMQTYEVYSTGSGYARQHNTFIVQFSSCYDSRYHDTATNGNTLPPNTSKRIQLSDASVHQLRIQ